MGNGKIWRGRVAIGRLRDLVSNVAMNRDGAGRDGARIPSRGLGPTTPALGSGLVLAVMLALMPAMSLAQSAGVPTRPSTGGAGMMSDGAPAAPGPAGAGRLSAGGPAFGEADSQGSRRVAAEATDRANGRAGFGPRYGLDGLTTDDRYSLAKFVPETGPIRLNGVGPRRSISIPFAGRLDLDSVEVRLTFTNSIALLPERSALTVRWNETAIGQVRLDRKGTRNQVRVPVPVELITAGFNSLTIEAAQHYTYECEDISAPELWTEIDTSRSEIIVNGTRNNDSITLARLDQVFSPGIGGVRDLTVVTPDVTVRPGALYWSGLIAQSTGLRLQYEPAIIRHQALGSGSLPDTDQVMAGTVNDLRGSLPNFPWRSVTGPVIAVLPAGSGGQAMRLVITGTSDDEVTTAALALLFIDFPLADAWWMRVNAIEGGGEQPVGVRKFLVPGTTYTLKDLGVPSLLIDGSGGTVRNDIALLMPADLWAGENAQVKLFLDLTYGAAFHPTSVFNIFLNGDLEHAIHLNDKAGGSFREYEVRIPLRSFSPGYNTLTFESYLVAEQLEPCVTFYKENLVMTLFNSSSLVLPKAEHYVPLPDLQLLAKTGIPLFQPDRLRSTGVGVLNTSPEVITAALTLVGKLTQVAAAPLPGLEVVPRNPTDKEHVLLVGTVQSLRPDLFRRAGATLGEVQRIPYESHQYADEERQQASEAVAADDGGGLGGWFDSVLGEGDESAGAPAEPAPTRTASSPGPRNYVAHGAGLGDTAIIMGFPSPNQSDGTVTLVTAETAEALLAGVARLVDPAFWDALKGDIMIWRDSPTTAETRTISPLVHVGDMNPISQASYHVSKSPWMWIIGALVIIVLLAVIANVLLRNRARRKNVDSHGD
ncbi:cellulose biosynthesis cyclic di-GMP-binding regulatory protein BcsB [Roseospira visakhapatnamensis]|uniref:Cyclic di-GMP-binding protein n=1 Tax=Roseospira visakhapatnamensis TaxID=390880 RepID=A0A7W6RBI2_9PROT|nr:cellulose biosynthesis cyclic di-GMP-binding regulatory protein BcsB [Roseospira visakhapatnamensis]MBB4265081.1 hypothetical protein [Roseospira visakhapatnamensis]